MHLVIRAQSLKQESISPSIVGEFDERGGTIGRSDSNTMTLPDPERHVSRLQAEITFAGGAFSLRNVGSSNPIIVNGRPLSPGEAVALRHQDQISIGSYELRVDLQAPAARAGARAVDARTVIGASAGEERTGPPRIGAPPREPAAPADDPFADLLGAPAKAGAVDPFADLLGPGSPAPSRAPAPPRAASPVAARLPEDFDPFADATAAAPLVDPPPAAPGPSPFQEVLGASAAGPSIDTVFGLKGGAASAADPLAAFLAPDAKAEAASSADPFAFLSGEAAPPVGPAAADHTPALQAAYRPPPVRSASPPLVAAPPPPPVAASVVVDVPFDDARPLDHAPQDDARAVTNASHDDALWDAFCEGAQLTLPTRVRLTPELMRLVGATLRHAVDGTVQLSSARTMVKQELHVPVTVIKPKGNNPLKFAPDAAAALAQMLQPPMRGFMAAPEAMQDAMTDLLGHSVGTMEGTRAALQGMLRRFEPSQLESQLAEGSMLDKLLPMNRRARLWELYLQHYGRISEAAKEDFDELFGKAFVKAYEAHADRVAAARRGR